MPKKYFLERFTLVEDEQTKKYGTDYEAWRKATDVKNIQKPYSRSFGVCCGCRG